jgi:hypothetical protein
MSRQASINARDAAMEAVDKSANEVWQEAAWQAILNVAVVYTEFTTDAVWHVLDTWGVPHPREPRAMGPMMSRAVGRGICVNTDRVSRSVRVACHRRPCAVYRSLKAGVDARPLEAQVSLFRGKPNK